MRRSASALALLAFAAVGTCFLAGVPGPAPAPPASARAAGATPAGAGTPRAGAPAVRLAPALRRDVAIQLQANGTVVPLSRVDIRAQVSRLLTRVHVEEGQFVGAGALLFSLDDRSERAALDKTRAQLARDQAALADLERQFKRSEDLSARHFIAASAAEQLQAQLDSQRATLQADQAALRAAQVELSYTTLRAPSAGRVGAIDVFAGTLVPIGATLASVTQMQPIGVSFTVPESGLAGLFDGQKHGAVAVTASLSEPARTLNGQLSFIDSVVDATAGTIRVKARFDNAGTALWPGQYVRATLTLATLRGAVVVPLAALVTNPGGSQVYTVGADQLARARPVRVLHAFGELAAVAGLDAGEQVVVEGKQNLRPGVRVRIGGGRDSGGRDSGKALADAGAVGRELAR